jgi:hypothetical protein
MKALVVYLVVVVAITGAHIIGYRHGVRAGQHGAIMAGATYATTACVAQELVTLRQMTRLIEAKNRKSIVVECRR